MKIRINNWAKYQQRTSGYKNCWWFSMSNRFLEDDEIWDLSDAEKIAWIYILCQASKKQKDELFVNFKHAQRSSNVLRENLVSAIKKLERFGIVATICTDADQDLNTTCTLQDRTRQDKTEQESKDSLLVAESSAPKPPKKKATKKGVLKVESVTELMHELGEEKYREWLDLYPDQEWVNHELKKAWLWYKDHNKHKKTARGWKTALTSWLGRGWDRHVNNKPVIHDRQTQRKAHTADLMSWLEED